MKRYIYPGSFDPVTTGHIDIINRSVRICDELIVAVLSNISKKPVFTTAERVDFIKKSLDKNTNIIVESFSGLLVDYVKERQASAIVRGLRKDSDFEYEFHMSILNNILDQDIETIYLMSNKEYFYISSSAVKEIAANNGNIDGLVPNVIKNKVLNRLKFKGRIHKA